MPANLDDILGQSSAIDALTESMTSGRLAHSLIFAGPAGVGKSTTAGALAAWWLCPNAGAPRAAGSRTRKSTAFSHNACGSCPSCRLIDSGTHPDYHVITRQLIRFHDKTGKSKGIDLSIQVLRPELIEPAGRKSSLGHGKAFIVEEAHLMNAAAQNGILKTLEEPPGSADNWGTLIILLADQPESLLPTIRSRCRIVTFAALETEIVKAGLAQRGIADADAAEAADMSDGSLGGALALIEDGMIAPAKDLCTRLDRLIDATGPVAADDIGELLKSAAEAFGQKRIDKDELASKDAATRQGLATYLHLMSQHLRRRLETLSAAPPGAAGRNLENICRAIDAIALSDRYLDANVNVAVALQQLSATLQGALRRVG
jgi:DNA polymerase-3 subunit delta'